MGKDSTHIADCSAYPGQYVPMPDIDELLSNKKTCMKQPAINMDEFEDFFKVQVLLPGIQRQDIAIFADDHTLTIKVKHKDHDPLPARSRIHEFDADYFERELSLPGDTDTQFTAAEYKEGILNLIIPKTTNQAKPHPGSIAVY